MNSNAWRSARTVIRYLVYLASGLVVLLALFAILVCVSFLMNPFAGFAGQSEFSNLPGYSARVCLRIGPRPLILEKCNAFRTNQLTRVTATQLGTVSTSVPAPLKNGQIKFTSIKKTGP